MGLPLARGVYDYLNEADRTGGSGPAPAQVYNAGGWRIALYRSGPFGTFRVVARRVEDNNYDA
ncbi:MAG: hypothetical protein NZ571_16350, partial [Anaerolineae bacterium]|nr:hypothetical protein [Anaerolineae bacterium]